MTKLLGSLLVAVALAVYGNERTYAEKLKFVSCSQGSNWDGTNHLCNKAYDGKLDTDTGGLLNCAHTGNENTWWKAKSEHFVRFQRVRIFNRATLRERLTDFEVIIIDENKVCNRYKNSEQFAYKTLPCVGYGQEIMVKSRLPQLTICEVEAFGKPIPKFKFVSCSQGSNQDDTNYMCNKAYDGKLDSDIGYLLNCAHTGKQNTWWKAKTDNPMLFMYVKIYNRDMLRERLTDFEVIIDDKNVCNRYKDSTQFAYKTLKCDGYGHEIMVKSYLPQLTICEFEAYGKPLPKFRFVSCSQGSNWDGTKHLCNKAYDGKLDTGKSGILNCAQTDKQDTWWKAKTEVHVRFMYVKIYNRATLRERLTDFEVIIDDNNVCNRYKDSKQFATKILQCDGIGQEIMVKSRLPRLAICEFEAYGKALQKFEFVTCSQGSYWDGLKHVCFKAYDGKLDRGTYGIYNCAHTDNQNPWWKAKTDNPMHFVYVKIYNRDILRERLTDFEVIIDDKNVCNRYKNPKLFATKLLRCEGYGHEIMVKSYLPKLTICEFEAFGEPMPKLKLVSCSQGSNQDEKNYLCDKAYDGKLDTGKLGLLNCAHTGKENTWWKAKTEFPVRFICVKIYNREILKERLTNFDVIIDDKNVCNRYNKSWSRFATKILRCDGYGQEIMVKSRLPQLTICEFEAYGKALPKLKFDGCSQGSNADDAKHLCHEAFDSSLAQCAITNSDNTWWKAQTSQPVWFMFVKIFSRAKQRDSLTNFEVLIDENVCNRYKDSTEFDTKILPCGGYGHEIMVRSHLPKLAICEFEAYGKVLQKLKLHGCRQGSSLPGGKNMCYKAYDGKTNEDGSLLNCARTGDRKTWWMAKTQQPVRFNYVKIYNQLKQREGLTDFEVIIDDKTVCNRYKNSTGFASKILKCDAYGQKIMVRSNRPNLTICEFEAYGETVPSEKKLKLVSCEQNTDRDNSTTCDKAIDNRLEYGKELGDHCAITSRNHSNTYWWARTEHPVRFTYVKLYDRLDFKNKQTDFDVLIDGKKVCTRYKPTDRFASKILRCDGYGQELKISTAAGQLTVCEFEAYGLTVPTDEKFKFVNCSQGSNWDGTNHLCNKAYDDKLDTSEPGSVINCAHTGKENTWWKAKTERPVRFKYVVIYNRATRRYRLTNFDVIIDEKNVCNRYQSIFFFAYKTMRCDGYGQEIMVKSRLPKLTICEFEAYGETVPTEDKIQLIGCRQGSNLNSTENLCDKAYDDKLDDPDNPMQNCAITNIDNTWWKAKTEYPVRFVYVKIYNRLTHRDTLTDFEVVIDERNVCNRYKNSTQFASKTLRCDGYGHEIMVRSHMPQLTICEFEAYGQKSIRHEKLKLVNCSQGSSLDGIKHSCDKAYDDKLDDPDNPIQNCAITNNDNTWWKAKTEHPVRFMYIKIYNRLTHRDTLTDFEVVIDETNVCNRYKDSTQFASKTLRCDASGQEIMVRSHLPKQLAICEIEAFGETLPMETEKLKLTNCSQGSDKFSSTSLCDRAYDNKLGDTLDHCALTNADNSWWRAQTEKPVRFIYVKIYNRLTKERQSRRTNLEVIIDEKKVCNRYTDSEYFLSKTLRCDGYGQEIMVKSNIPYLTLCEFEAYGESLPAEDKLPLTRCKQSSSYYTHTCEKAIDDRLEDPSTHLQTCAFVDSARAGWWRAATDYQVQFMMVKIYNRLNRRSGLTNFAIYIDEKSECSRYSNGEEFSSKALPCEGVGQEIMVKSSLGYLTICELEAFGKFLPQRQ